MFQSRRYEIRSCEEQVLGFETLSEHECAGDFKYEAQEWFGFRGGETSALGSSGFFDRPGA